MFKIIKKDNNSKARLGVLKTPHGQVLTPAYVMVGTYGHIRHLSPADIRRTKTQMIIANTYHLWDKVPKQFPISNSQFPNKARKSKIQNSKQNTFLTKKLGTSIPTMTDSGGFQVFSLAFGRNSKAGKIFPRGTAETQKRTKNTEKDTKRKNVRITEKCVYFKKSDDLRCRHLWQFLGPELSMKIQEKLGADIIFAFDECTSFFDDFKYNKKAMERTHKWAKICLESRINSDSRLRTGTFDEKNLESRKQMLFGIVQGGRYKTLRVKSAKFIGSLPFDGFGIGGSFGKEEMAKMLRWVIPHLPEEKPRHLLGVGRIEDIFRAVENGVDLFDCVIPTREARHGRIWTKNGKLDIRKGIYANDNKTLDNTCDCLTCTKKVSRATVRKLFKSNKPAEAARGQRYALMHNMWFFNNFVEQIRDSIAKDKFREFKKKFLTRLHK